MRRILCITLLATSTTATTTLADPIALEPRPTKDRVLEPIAPTPPTEKAPPGTEPTEVPIAAKDVTDAPGPGREHGRIDPLTPPRPSAARTFARGLLLIPRLGLELVAQPARNLLELQDRYNVVGAVASPFVNKSRTIAVFPTALFETGFGLNVGGRAYFRDVFGGDERIQARVAYGGAMRKIGELSVSRSTKRWAAGVDLRYDLADNERFYGYGNGNETVATMPIDPLATEVAAPSAFVSEVMRVSPRFRLSLSEDVSLTATAAVVRKRFPTNTPAGEPPLTETYMAERVPGLAGTTFLYDELELAWDTRRSAHPWDAPGMVGAGGVIMGFVARQQGLLPDEPGFFRLGMNLRRHVRLTVGPRVLSFGLYGEMVTGARDEVPFTELPRLGGRYRLRGYPTDRFRDRVALVGEVSYSWAVASWFAPSLFVEAGRVHRSLADISLDNTRVGYGIAFEAFGQRTSMLRMEVASSIEGGVQFFLSLDPLSSSGLGRRY